MKLKPTYNDRGEKRTYYMGEDGNEYFMYHDELTGYTIREMNKDDVLPWFKAIKEPELKVVISPMNRVIYFAKLSEKIESMIGESTEKTMLVLNPKNEIIGELDFTEKNPGDANLQVFLKDEKTIKMKGSRVVEVIRKMNESERLYDEIFLENDKGQIVRLC